MFGLVTGESWRTQQEQVCQGVCGNEALWGGGGPRAEEKTKSFLPLWTHGYLFTASTKEKLLFYAGKLLSIHPGRAYIINTPLPVCDAAAEQKTEGEKQIWPMGKHGWAYNMHNKEWPSALIICTAVMKFPSLYQTSICETFSVASPHVIMTICDLSQTLIHELSH